VWGQVGRKGGVEGVTKEWCGGMGEAQGWAAQKCGVTQVAGERCCARRSISAGKVAEMYKYEVLEGRQCSAVKKVQGG